MAYLIGNTTVITNNGALGSVDGNNLNLASNNNIAAGGASYTSVNSTTNQASGIGTAASLAMVTGGGGGVFSGFSGNTRIVKGSGAGGSTGIRIVPGQNSAATFTIGGQAGVSTLTYENSYIEGIQGNSGNPNNPAAPGNRPSRDDAGGQSGNNKVIWDIRGGEGNNSTENPTNNPTPGGGKGGFTVWNIDGTPRGQAGSALGGGAGSGGGFGNSGTGNGGNGRIVIIGFE